jgi:phospholipase C
MTRKRIAALSLAVAGISVVVAQAAFAGTRRSAQRQRAQVTRSLRATNHKTNASHHRARLKTAGVAHDDAQAATPIKHLVVIFQENVSYDHYFGTYPYATNPPGEPAFHAAPGTPTPNGLSGTLLTNNPNSANPQRLDRAQALTCDQDHDYTAEQEAFDHGLMDKFVQSTNTPTCTTKGAYQNPTLVMDYYDGNTVTGLWNYAQHFAMSDNSYSTTFGPSTPGALNVTSANSYGAICGSDATAVYPPLATCPAAGSVATGPSYSDPAGTGTVFGDDDPAYDSCSKGTTIGMGAQNIGDLLDQAGVSWGWFQGGFADKNYVPGDSSTDKTPCNGSHTNIAGNVITDYSPHHEPFQYYRSTANPMHLPPTSIAMIGHQDQANHQYDLKDFWAAADSGNLPAVSYLKAARYQDGHPSNSDPLDEQDFLVSTINRLEKLPSWRSTAVVIAYDDSDGWYDHQMSPIIMQSQTPLDALTDPGSCGSDPTKVPTGSAGPQEARCGAGPRQPLLVVSPYSKPNFVDGTFTTQSSIVRFIEDNWLGGQRLGNGAADAWAGPLSNMLDFSRPSEQRLFLDPSSGEPAAASGNR